MEPAPDDGADQEGFRAQFLAAFGTTELAVAEALYQQLLNSLCPGKMLDTGTANLALALMHSIAPRDEIETMVAMQMIITHAGAMDASRRGLHRRANLYLRAICAGHRGMMQQTPRS